MICSGPSAPLLISAAQLDGDDADGGEGVNSVALGHTPVPVSWLALAAETVGPWRYDLTGAGKTEVFSEV